MSKNEPTITLKDEGTLSYPGTECPKTNLSIREDTGGGSLLKQYQALEILELTEDEYSRKHGFALACQSILDEWILEAHHKRRLKAVVDEAKKEGTL